MQTTAPKTSTSPVGCSPIFFVLVFVFIFFTISASIPPLNNLIARYALCPTASEAYFTEASGGTVDKPGNQNDVSGRVVTLFCEYDNAPIREVDNDSVVVTGFGVSAGLGAVVGLVVYFSMYLKAKVSNPVQ